MSQVIQTPFPQSFWVREGLLCAGHYPGDLDPALRDTKLIGLLDCGIRCVLSLMQSDEKGHDGKPFEPYVPRLEELAGSRSESIECITMPVRDTTAPTRKVMQEILDRLDVLMEGNVPTYLHCWGGHGRTGTVVCCHLIRHGRSAQQAIEHLLQLRAGLPKNRYPFEGGQKEFVREWASDRKAKKTGR